MVSSIGSMSMGKGEFICQFYRVATGRKIVEDLEKSGKIDIVLESLRK